MTTTPGGGYEWPALPVLDPEEAAEILADRLQAAWDDLEAERVSVVQSLTMGRKDLVDAWIREFQGSINGFRNDVSAHVQRFIDLHLAPRYQEGVEQVSGPMSTWTSMHTLALSSLAIDTYGDFLQRAFEAGRVSEAFVRAVRRAASVELPKLAAGGRTALQAADRMEKALLEQGIDHVIYRDGSQVPVRAYVRMAARTKSAVAYSAGTLNECVAADIGYVEVFDGVECGWSSHGDEDKARGSIRTVVEAARYPIAHPQCTRAFGPRPDITTDAEAEAARSSTTTEQDEDQEQNADWTLAGGRPDKKRPREGARERRQQKREERARDVQQDPLPVGDVLAELGLTPPAPVQVPIDVLTDAELEAGLNAAVEAGDWDLVEKYGDEIDRRGAIPLEEQPVDLPDDPDDAAEHAVDEFDAYNDETNWQYVEATGEWAYRGPITETAKAAGVRRRTQAEIRAETAQAFAEHAALEQLAAEAATNGVLIRRDRYAEWQRRGSPDLFTCSLDTAFKFASEELRDYWESHPRLTVAEIGVRMGDETADVVRRASQADKRRQELSFRAERKRKRK